MCDVRHQSHVQTRSQLGPCARYRIYTRQHMPDTPSGAGLPLGRGTGCIGNTHFQSLQHACPDPSARAPNTAAPANKRPSKQG